MIDTMPIRVAHSRRAFAQKFDVRGATICGLSSCKGQWCAGDVADCFDQEAYGPCIPINPVDGRFPIMGHHIGRVARLHTQSSDRTRWRLHDRPFNRRQPGQDGLDFLSRNFIITIVRFDARVGY